MSSPYEPGTKRGTEETLQAISNATRWASRIDTNDLADIDVDVDIDTFVSELNEAEEELREKYRIKTTEVSIDNFVFNQEDRVRDILAGDLDTKVEAIKELESYISDDFGTVRPLSLSKEELVWLVAQEVRYHQESSFSSTEDVYETEPLASMDLSNAGSVPSQWEDGTFPRYNRDN